MSLCMLGQKRAKRYRKRYQNITSVWKCTDTSHFIFDWRYIFYGINTKYLCWLSSAIYCCTIFLLLWAGYGFRPTNFSIRFHFSKDVCGEILVCLSFDNGFLFWFFIAVACDFAKTGRAIKSLLFIVLFFTSCHLYVFWT